MSANRDKRRQYNEISSIIRQSSIKAVRSRGNNKIGNHPYKFSTGEATVKGIWNAITDVLDDIVNAIVLLLPDSPFKDVEIPAEVKQLFGYVNYFVPVTAMLAIGTTWLTAIGVYYLYKTILR